MRLSPEVRSYHKDASFPTSAWLGIYLSLLWPDLAHYVAPTLSNYLHGRSLCSAECTVMYNRGSQDAGICITVPPEDGSPYTVPTEGVLLRLSLLLGVLVLAMMKLLTSSALALALAGPAFARTFTVYNGCPFTIWPAIFSQNPANAPSYTTGWEAAAYTAVSFYVPDDWTAGRIWARRDCNFDGSTSPNTCLDGGCNGGLVCDPTTGTGVPPATLAEFTLSPTGNDNYDVSLVDGYNLPMSITNNVGCPVADCPVDLGPNCPAPYQGPYDSTGFPVGCRSACDVDPDPSNSPACCSGQYDTPQTCPSSGDPTYSYFKSNCPNSYAYAYDESSGTALWQCPGSSAADYTVTFCPPPS